MKNISTVLKKGNLSAKERALIYISTQVEQEKTGKKILDAKLIEAIKDKKAFINDRYIDAFNNHVKVWTKKVFIETDMHALYAKSSLTLEALKVLAFNILKSSLLSAQIKTSLTKLQELNKDETSNDYFVLGLYHTELLNPFVIVKADSSSAKKMVDLEENLKFVVATKINSFEVFYSNLLALQKVLKVVSEELGIDISYNVDSCIKMLKRSANSYNQLIDAGLPDFENIKSSVEKTLQAKDKIYADRKSIYLDLNELTYDEKTYSECLEMFEELFGKNFWENN